MHLLYIQTMQYYTVLKNEKITATYTIDNHTNIMSSERNYGSKNTFFSFVHLSFQIRQN